MYILHTVHMSKAGVRNLSIHFKYMSTREKQVITQVCSNLKQQKHSAVLCPYANILITCKQISGQPQSTKQRLPLLNNYEHL